MSAAAGGDSGTALTNGEADRSTLAPSVAHVATTATAKQQGGKKYCLPIQAVIHEYRMKHGLRHQDFFRYRGYCSRRLKHIRKTLKFTQASHKKHFQKKPVHEECIRDLRYLEILLLNAERAWAHSMQLKDESELEARRIHHSTRKLAHACEVAKQLEKICNIDGPRCKVDVRTSLEAKAYYNYMEGLYCQTKREWTKALTCFKNSVALYEKIKLILPEEKREPYETQISEVKPLINFCSYNLGENSEADLSNVSELIADFDKLKLLKSNVGNEEEVDFSWLGQTVHLKLPYWKNFMASMENFQAEILKAINEESKISVLDHLLDETRQVQAKLREEVKSGASGGKQPSGGEAEMSNGVSSKVDNPIMFLLGYVTFIKLTKGIQKNILFLYSLVSKEGSIEVFSEAAKKLKPQSFLKFFESCQEFIEEIQNIEYVEQFGEFGNLISVLNTQKEALSSFSLYQLGRCYAAQNEWTNSLALFSRSKQIAAAVNENDLIPRDNTNTEVDSTLICALLKNFLLFIESEIYCAYTSCISNQYSSQQSANAASVATDNNAFEGTLDQNLNQWVKLTPSTLKNLKITSLPPEYKPVPAKPLFFDIASNHVKLPSAVQAKVQASNQAKGGIGGYFRGWWGGGQK